MKDLIRRGRAYRPATTLEGDEEAEGGFTLVELMVVLLLIAILLAIAIPTYLGLTGNANDRSAQSNLTNALTEAKALYQVTGAFSDQGGVYTSGNFSSQAPEFDWISGDCVPANQQGCISVQVVDVSAQGDDDGVVLAAWDPNTQTCWYAVDLENNPASIADANAFEDSTAPGGDANSLGTGGVYFGKYTFGSGGTPSCSASQAADPTTNANWGTNYTNAGNVN
jgi:prepilin-type N-terminal cleavage/methylation domain-containing protein